VSEKVERLVNLTIALLEARRPVTFQELRSRTTLYPQADAESARRMFERDKSDLRSLGVPVEVRAVALSDDEGYIVERKRYELPDVDLDAEEVAALALALRLTDQPSTVALAALAARAPDPAAVEQDPGTRVGLGATPVDDVADAVLGRVPVTFDYRTADGTEGPRTLDPYGVVKRRGAWYLVGRDHSRDAVRAFRLDRVLGSPRPAGPAGAFERPDDVEVAKAVSGPEADGVEARIAVAPGAAWALRSRGATETGELHGDWPVYAVPQVDAYRDLAWLLGLGGEVVVLAPTPLRERLVGALRQVAEGAR
jgi:proteasome accessory factor B